MESTANPSSASADTKICSNCNKPIEISKFRMHEIGCARNNIKCPQCREIVLKSDLPAHEAEYHTVMNCEYCNDFECEKMLMKDHQQYCDMKPRQCHYCELKFPGGNQYDNHLAFCGSKTTKCEDCGQLVRNKDQRTHKVSDTCKLIREMEDEKISKELQKFQEEEEKRMKGGPRRLNKLENETNGENYKQSKGNKQNEAVTKIVSSMTKIQDKETIERGYIKSKNATKEKHQLMNQFKSKPNQPANKQKQSPKQNSQSVFDEEMEQEMMARKLQEEFDREEAMRLQEEFGGLGPGISQDGFIDEDGTYVRPPEEIYEDQLIQADDDYNPRTQIQLNKRNQKIDYKQQRLDSSQSKKNQPASNSRDISNNSAQNSRNTRQNPNQTSNQNNNNRNQSSNNSFNTRQTANSSSNRSSSNQPTLLQKRQYDHKQSKNRERKPKYQESNDDVDSELYQNDEDEDEYEPNYSQESMGGRKNKDKKQQNQSANSKRGNRRNVIDDNDDEDDAEEAMIRSTINKSKHHK